MSEGEVRVRSVATRRSESFTEQAMEFGGGVVRLGFSIFTLPFALMPPETRRHLRNATEELMHAFASLPADFANIAGKAIEDWAAEGEEATPPAKHAPHDEMSAS
jgi:hypothetical protein